MAVSIRFEEDKDWTEVFAINEAAFGNTAEAVLVDKLRKKASPIISMVAEDGGSIVGHIMFSPAALSGHSDVKLMGLAPMAIIPKHQNKGIGSDLVTEGLKQCRAMGYDAVIVLGHPEYYPRFGFKSAKIFDIISEYDVPDGTFMIVEFETDVLKGKPGTVKYHEVFGEL